MTSDTKRRFLVYGLVFLVLGGLVYGGFIYKAEADVPTLVNSAEILAQCRIYPKSIEFAERALKQEPDHRYAHIILGYAYSETGDYASSIEHYGRALELTPKDDPKRGTLVLYRAEALICAGRTDEAIRDANGLLERDPEAVQAYYTLARASLACGRPQDAEAAYLAAREKRPDDIEPVLLLSDLERSREDLGRALELLEDAERIRPGSPSVALRTAVVLVAKGETNRGVEMLQDVAKTRLVKVRNAFDEFEELEPVRDDPRIVALFAEGEGDSGSTGTDEKE